MMLSLFACFLFQMAMDKKKTRLPACDFYCDMLYLLPYSSFVKLPESKFVKELISWNMSLLEMAHDRNMWKQITTARTT